MNEWYKYSEEERIKEVYSKFTIKDFWDWWQGEEINMMEVRIMDFELLRNVAHELNIPFCDSGVFVKSAEELKAVIARVRNKATMWFGVNPRIKNYNKKGWKTFSGKDHNISQINFLLIDIDRTVKNGPASNVDLENGNRLADLIIERMGTQGWNNNYCKICSGNGVQLLFKLDYPIKVPTEDFDSKTNTYISNQEFDKIKNLIPTGIGNDIIKFCKKYKEDLGVEVDKSVFKLSVVASLPFTKNYKYDSFTWRGLIEKKDGVNEGLSDYILSKIDDVETFVAKNVFVSKAINQRDRIKPGKLSENILIRFMLDNDLPQGMRNNYLWFQVKCLLRDNKFDITSDEFKRVHLLLEKKYDALPPNFPDKKFVFDENIVNKYCIVNGIPPIYPLWPRRTKRNDRYIIDVKFDDIDLVDVVMKLDSDTTILDDMDYVKKQFKDSPENKLLFLSFVKGCIEKYGLEKTRYYFEYIMKRYLCYD